LEKLLPGDAVLTGIGYIIVYTLAIHGAGLKILAFTKGKSQLPNKEVIDKSYSYYSLSTNLHRISEMSEN
jgi:hypothetical protein